jgi:hypothetical protein
MTVSFPVDVRPDVLEVTALPTTRVLNSSLFPASEMVTIAGVDCGLSNWIVDTLSVIGPGGDCPNTTTDSISTNTSATAAPTYLNMAIPPKSSLTHVQGWKRTRHARVTMTTNYWAPTRSFA